MKITITVNGSPRTAEAPGRRLLSDFLRHDLGLTGTHVGCEHGVCGCCTVLFDGDPVRSCLMLAATADGHEVTTVEGLGDMGGGSSLGEGGGETTSRLSPVQRGFQERHGLQCGFCTPGFLCTATAFLRDNPQPDDEEIVEAISGNLCRCTGYQNIVESVRRAAELAGQEARE